MNAPIANEPVDELLKVQDLDVFFSTSHGVAEVVNGVTLSVRRGMMHGLVGESGSGKSVTSRAVMGLLPKTKIARLGGSIQLDGEDLLNFSEDQMRNQIRGLRISMVFQDPMTALNPVLKLGVQLTNPLRLRLGLSKSEAVEKAVELLDQVGIPEPRDRMSSFPHQLSGGQRQRVMIALALTCNPELLIADEPTTALDVTVQAQIMDLFDTLRTERSLAVLFVSHDLSLIAERCDEVSVMYAGRIVETGPAQEIFASPAHPYTMLLERARPTLDSPPHTELETIPGSPPALVEQPKNCAFAARCPFAQEICHAVRPDLKPGLAGRKVACHFPLITQHQQGTPSDPMCESSSFDVSDGGNR